MTFSPSQLVATLRGLPPARRYWAAFSGGLDSTVLLSALALRRAELGAELCVVHVNHQLNPASGVWQAHCERFCGLLQLPLVCRRVLIRPSKGESLEAAAREERYRAYRELIEPGDILLLAHHRDDQMETFLLQGLRGAGLAGLAAMPSVMPFGPGVLARPLLESSRLELRVWAEAHRLAWLDDPSNGDPRFGRNYLRGQVISVIRQRWPAAAETVTRSARHCAEAQALLIEVARQDLASCVDEGGRVTIADLQRFSRPRAKNLLRYWIAGLALPTPAAHKIEQIFTDLVAARVDRNPSLGWDGGEIRRYRNRLHGLPPLPPPPQGGLRLHCEGLPLAIPGLGTLRLVATQGAGLRAARCPAMGLEVSFRHGGERCQPAGAGHRRPLKKWLQEQRVVPWMRSRLPLLYIDGELAAVAGLFVCAPFAAGAHEPGLRIEWQDHPPLH